MWDAVKASFEILADDHTALHGFDSSMLDHDGKIRVRGLRGKSQIRKGPGRYEEHVRISGQRVRVAGFKNVAEPGQPEIWEAWTRAQVDAERVRRHPDQIVGPHQPAAAPSFQSVLGVAPLGSARAEPAEPTPVRELAA